MQALTLSIKNEVSEIETIHQALRAKATDYAFSPEEISKLCILTDEVLSNIIQYSYEDTSLHSIDFRLLGSADRLILEFEDDGRYFNPTRYEQSMMENPENRLGGLGLEIIRKLSQEFKYQRHDNRNFLTLELLRNPSNGQNPIT
jgi:serine/threonine-protein kinase RsbW